MRSVARETDLRPIDLVLPVSIRPGQGVREPIVNVPGAFETSADEALFDVSQAVRLGIETVLVHAPSGASNHEAAMSEAVRVFRREASVPLLIAEACSTGEAVAHARAGADAIVTSHDAEGGIRVIRTALDAAGFSATSLIAVGTSSQRLRRGAGEGADMLMVADASSRLDEVRSLEKETELPVLADQGTAAYARAMAAGARGWVDVERILTELLLAARRAGAKRIVSYHALACAASMQR